MASFNTRKTITKDGKEKKSYRVQYVTLEGQRKGRQFKVRKKALEFLKAIEAHLEEGKKGLPVKVSEASDMWLEACAIGTEGNYGLERHTIDTYKGHMRNHILPEVGDIYITHMLPSDVRKMRDNLIKKCHSRATAKASLTCFKSFIAYCYSNQMIQSNVADGITIKMSGRRKNNSIEIPSKKEMKILSDKALELRVTHKGSWVRYCPMFFILTYCGLRISELLGLQRQAIDFKECSIDIYQRADRFGVIGPPKTKYGYRKVYYPERLNELIHGHLSTHNFELAFASHSGTAMAQRNVHRRMWMTLINKSGLENNFKLHSLRHFYASLMINSGTDVKQLSVSMGHHDVAFTLQTYGHLFNDKEDIDQRKAIANNLLL